MDEDLELDMEAEAEDVEDTEEVEDDLVAEDESDDEQDELPDDQEPETPVADVEPPVQKAAPTPAIVRRNTAAEQKLAEALSEYGDLADTIMAVIDGRVQEAQSVFSATTSVQVQRAASKPDLYRDHGAEIEMFVKQGSPDLDRKTLYAASEALVMAQIADKEGVDISDVAARYAKPKAHAPAAQPKKTAPVIPAAKRFPTPSAAPARPARTLSRAESEIRQLMRLNNLTRDEAIETRGGSR